MDNLEEMDKFLEKYNFPKLNQEEIENLNRPITSTETETVIRNLPENCRGTHYFSDSRHPVTTACYYSLFHISA